MSWGWGSISANSGQKSDQSWKDGWRDSGSSSKGSWGKGWGNPLPKSDKKGKGWGNSSSEKGSSSDKKGEFQKNESSVNNKSNGWGKSSSSQSIWTGIEFKNPFSKSENSQPSVQNKKADLNEIFKTKPIPPAIEYNFGTGVIFHSTNNPNLSFTDTAIRLTSFNMPKPPPKRPKIDHNDNDDDDSKSMNLKEVDEITGEEGEDIIFNEKSLVFDLRKNDEGKYEYHEYGSGDFHFNYNKENDCYRMTMRRDKQNIVLNTRIYKEMKPRIKKRTVQFLTPIKDKDNVDKLIMHTFQFRTEDIAQRLFDLIVDAISKL